MNSRPNTATAFVVALGSVALGFFLGFYFGSSSKSDSDAVPEETPGEVTTVEDSRVSDSQEPRSEEAPIILFPQGELSDDDKAVFNMFEDAIKKKIADTQNRRVIFDENEFVILRERLKSRLDLSDEEIDIVFDSMRRKNKVDPADVVLKDVPRWASESQREKGRPVLNKEKLKKSFSEGWHSSKEEIFEKGWADFEKSLKKPGKQILSDETILRMKEDILRSLDEIDTDELDFDDLKWEATSTTVIEVK